jgi:hypothetical protein
MLIRKLLWILWPAFLGACLLQLVVFALVDPQEVQWLHEGLGLSRQAVYAAGFFTFWAVCIAACSLTTLLRMAPDDVNRCPFDPARRPPGCPSAADPRDA